MKESISNIEVFSNSIAIIGWHDGGAGQIHSWFQKSGEYHVACFVNPIDEQLNINIPKINRDVSQFSYPEGEKFKDLPLINRSDWYSELSKLGINKIIITITNLRERYNQINKAKEYGFELVNAIHSSVLIMDDAILGENLMIYPQVHVGYRAEIHTGVALNTGVQLDHHNVIRECAAIDPGVVFAGNVTVGRFTQVHTGVVVKNRIRIGEDSIIGAGSVIINDVPDRVTVVGVPGRIIKHHKQICK